MTNPAPFGRGAPSVRVPRGEVLGEFETYQEAADLVDRLVRSDFEIAKVSIVGSDLKMVEHVVRRRSWGRAALEGLLSGAWFGLFVALLFSLLQPTINWSWFIAAVLIGAGFGMFFRLASYAVSRRRRDFESTSQVLASSYQVIVENGLLLQAQAALAKPAE